MCLFLSLPSLLSLPVRLPLESGPLETHFWGASEIQGIFGTVMREIGHGANNKNKRAWSGVMCYGSFTALDFGHPGRPPLSGCTSRDIVLKADRASLLAKSRFNGKLTQQVAARVFNRVLKLRLARSIAEAL